MSGSPVPLPPAPLASLTTTSAFMKARAGSPRNSPTSAIVRASGVGLISSTSRSTDSVRGAVSLSGGSRSAPATASSTLAA